MEICMRGFTCLFVLTVLAAWVDCAFADNEVLTFRLDNTGHSAVINGLSGPCNWGIIPPPDTVDVGPATIAINSIDRPIFGCTNGPDNYPYQVVAPLGVLAPGIYSVAWTTSAARDAARRPVVAARLAVFGPPAPIPALSNEALLVLLTLIAVLSKRSPS
jgi:hypothetical protein